MTDGLSYLESLQGSGIRPGLGRIRAVLRALGHPERTYRSVIVAGTNGKGSTAAMIASILRESGYRTALYTSPHLVDVHERWTIDGSMIDDGTLDRSVAQLRVAADSVGIVPTYFEAMTLVAFIAFRLARCEVAVLEVGMGGRLDATNVVKPIASVITPVGFDHMEFLGTTIRRIAAEKAGVIHRGAIAITSNEGADVLDVLRRRCERVDATLQVVRGEHDTPLAGEFQRRNAALAVATARALAAALTKIDEAAIERGVASTRWRGRLDHTKARGRDIWIDGCHNAHAAAAVAPFIVSSVPRPRTLVFGIMGDKDVADVTRILFPLFDSVIATEPFPPRSLPGSSIVAAAQALGLPAVSVPDPAAALERALDGPGVSVFVAGSLYLAGAAIAFLDSLSE